MARAARWELKSPVQLDQINSTIQRWHNKKRPWKILFWNNRVSIYTNPCKAAKILWNKNDWSFFQFQQGSEAELPVFQDFVEQTKKAVTIKEHHKCVRTVSYHDDWRNKRLHFIWSYQLIFIPEVAIASVNATNSHSWALLMQKLDATKKQLRCVMTINLNLRN